MICFSSVQFLTSARIQPQLICIQNIPAYQNSWKLHQGSHAQTTKETPSFHWAKNKTMVQIYCIFLVTRWNDAKKNQELNHQGTIILKTKCCKEILFYTYHLSAFAKKTKNESWVMIAKIAKTRTKTLLILPMIYIYVEMLRYKWAFYDDRQWQPNENSNCEENCE